MHTRDVAEQAKDDFIRMQDIVATYDASGLLTSETITTGSGFASVTTYTYDAAKRLVSVRKKDGEDVLTEIAYDAKGRKILETTAGEKTVFTYDADGRLAKSERIAAGTTHSMLRTYDSAGRLSTETRLMDGAPWERTTHEYGEGGKLTALTRDGLKTTYEYDAKGRVTVESTHGSYVRHLYTCSEPFPKPPPLTAVRKFPGPCRAETPGGADFEYRPVPTKFGYEGDRLVSMKTMFPRVATDDGDWKEVHVTLTYDAFGDAVFRLRKTFAGRKIFPPSETRVAYKHAADGARSTDRGADGSFEARTTFEKDASGRVVSQTTTIAGAPDLVVLFERDGQGRVLRAHLPSGKADRRFLYDDKGNLLAEKPPLLDADPFNPYLELAAKERPNGMTRYFYDCWK